MRLLAWQTWVVSALVVVVGCDDHVFPNATPTDTTAYVPSFDGFEAFFGDHCEGCHPSLNGWDVEATRKDIVDNTGRFVVPGDPDGSLLWRVIIGADANVALMPLGFAQPLDGSVTAHVRQWILDGASLE